MLLGFCHQGQVGFSRVPVECEINLKVVHFKIKFIRRCSTFQNKGQGQWIHRQWKQVVQERTNCIRLINPLQPWWPSSSRDSETLALLTPTLTDFIELHGKGVCLWPVVTLGRRCWSFQGVREEWARACPAEDTIHRP